MRERESANVSSGVSFARIFAVCTLGNKALYVESVDQGEGGLGLTERLAGTFTAYQLLTMTSAPESYTSTFINNTFAFYILTKAKRCTIKTCFQHFWLILVASRPKTKKSRFYQDK